MNALALSRLDLDDLLQSLQRDGGRTVVYGGDPYEDDLEPEGPLVSGAPTPEAAAA